MKRRDETMLIGHGPSNCRAKRSASARPQLSSPSTRHEPNQCFVGPYVKRAGGTSREAGSVRRSRSPRPQQFSRNEAKCCAEGDEIAEVALPPLRMIVGKADGERGTNLPLFVHVRTDVLGENGPVLPGLPAIEEKHQARGRDCPRADRRKGTWQETTLLVANLNRTLRGCYSAIKRGHPVKCRSLEQRRKLPSCQRDTQDFDPWARVTIVCRVEGFPYRAVATLATGLEARQNVK